MPTAQTCRQPSSGFDRPRRVPAVPDERGICNRRLAGEMGDGMTKILIDRAVVEQALNMFERGRFANKDVDELEALCDVLHAALEQPQVEQMPIRWPANASEVRAFLSGHVAAERYARDDHQPDDSDTYTLSAHDLLGAIDWWTDFDQRPRQPLTPEAVNDLWIKHARSGAYIHAFARAIERAHGIGGEA